MNVLVSAFDDLHDHSIAVDGWNQVYRQISPGAFHSRLVQIYAPGFRCFREETNQRMIQQGVSPDGFASLAVPLYRPFAGTFQGHPVNGYAFLMLDANETFRFHTQEVMHIIGVSLPVGEMADLVGAVTGRNGQTGQTMRAINGTLPGVLPMRGEHGAILHERIAPFLDYAERHAALLAHPGMGKMFRDELLGHLLDLLDATTDGAPGNLTHRTYSEIVWRSEKIVQEQMHGGAPVTVLDLCRALRCSRRTLQTSFQRVTNVTPVAYLRAWRLNAVRELLHGTCADEMSIGDAANRWGFGHLGYFAREYRVLFSEMPSQTRRRN